MASPFDDRIEKVLEDKEIGVLIVTEKIYELSKERFDEIREKYKMPLLVRI